MFSPGDYSTADARYQAGERPCCPTDQLVAGAAAVNAARSSPNPPTVPPNRIGAVGQRLPNRVVQAHRQHEGTVTHLDAPSGDEART